MKLFDYTQSERTKKASMFKKFQKRSIRDSYADGIFRHTNIIMNFIQVLIFIAMRTREFPHTNTAHKALKTTETLWS